MKELFFSEDGSIILTWKAVHIDGRELYQFEGNKENPTRIFHDWSADNELNELYLINPETKDEIIRVNFMDGSLMVMDQLIKFENHEAPYRAVHYFVTKQQSFSGDRSMKILKAASIIEYCIGWKYVNKKNQVKKAILHLDARTADWYVDTEQ